MGKIKKQAAFENDLALGKVAFERADPEGRGSIMLDQLSQTLLDESIVDKLLPCEQLALFDTNGDNEINLQEFLILWMELKSRIELQKSRLLIDMFPDPPKPSSRVGFNAAKPLPCFDESDDGVPPICQGDAKWWKLFNHHHPVTNKNIACAVWGNIGFKYFDRRRHHFMALRFVVRCRQVLSCETVRDRHGTEGRQ